MYIKFSLSLLQFQKLFISNSLEVKRIENQHSKLLILQILLIWPALLLL